MTVRANPSDEARWWRQTTEILALFAALIHARGVGDAQSTTQCKRLLRRCGIRIIFIRRPTKRKGH
jgi:hypothetical protein